MSSAHDERAVSPAVLGAAFDAVPFAMLVADDTGRYVAANPAASKLLARDRDEILQMSIADVSPPGADVGSAWKSFLDQGHTSGEYTLVRPDAAEVDVHYEAYAHIVPGYHLSVLREIGHVRRLERDLAGAHRRADSILDSISDAFLATDSEWRITYVNRATEEMMGLRRDEVLGLTLWDAFPGTRDSAFERNYRRAMADERAVTFEARYPEPLDAWFDVRAHPLREGGLAIYATDITEQHRMRGELEEARRLESLAALSAGISHEFNTVMAMVRGHADLIRENLGAGHHPHLAAIDDALDHALSLTSRLLAFARQQDLEQEVVHLNDVVTELRPLIEPLLVPKIELRFELTDDDDVLVAVGGLLEQCILDLVTNARDAMPDGGTLTIATGTQAVDGGGPSSGQELAFLRVTDTGTGMDRPTRQRAVEPFFTTKRAGGAAGMGLSSAFGVVRQIGGTLEIDSEPGVGTTVTVLVPIVSD